VRASLFGNVPNYRRRDIEYFDWPNVDRSGTRSPGNVYHRHTGAVFFDARARQQQQQQRPFGGVLVTHIVYDDDDKLTDNGNIHRALAICVVLLTLVTEPDDALAGEKRVLRKSWPCAKYSAAVDSRRCFRRIRSVLKVRSALYLFYVVPMEIRRVPCRVFNKHRRRSSINTINCTYRSCTFVLFFIMTDDLRF